MNKKIEYKEIAFQVRDKVTSKHTYDIDINRLLEIVIEQQCTIHTLKENNEKLERNIMEISRLLIKAGIIDGIEVVNNDGTKTEVVAAVNE